VRGDAFPTGIVKSKYTGLPVENGTFLSKIQLPDQPGHRYIIMRFRSGRRPRGDFGSTPNGPPSSALPARCPVETRIPKENIALKAMSKSTPFYFDILRSINQLANTQSWHRGGLSVRLPRYCAYCQSRPVAQDMFPRFFVGYPRSSRIDDVHPLTPDQRVPGPSGGDAALRSPPQAGGPA